MTTATVSHAGDMRSCGQGMLAAHEPADQGRRGLQSRRDSHGCSVLRAFGAPLVLNPAPA